MHSQTIAEWQHDHVFLGAGHARNAKRTWIVVALTAAMMVAEIVAGLAFGSMALLTDGVHMATHAGALALAALAYLYARRHARDDRFTFGTGKLGELAGYTSAIVLALFALMIAVEAVARLAQPVAIRFDEAIAVATLGLLVNLASAWVLQDREHRHGEDNDDRNLHHHRDHNLQSAYIHVLTDALTSILAIVALLAGRLYGWVWMDPVMSMVGSLVIAQWAWGLLRGSGAVLLDAVPGDGLSEQIRKRLEIGDDRVSDLHVWRVGPGHLAAIVSLVSNRPEAPDQYKARLGDLTQLSHVTVEVHRCPHPA